MTKFRANPQTYLNPAKAESAQTAPEGTTYACPMHPEIRLPAAGSCPICGMALEPLMPSLDEEEHPELVDFRRRFWWTLPLTRVVFMSAMFGHLFSPQAFPIRTGSNLR